MFSSYINIKIKDSYIVIILVSNREQKWIIFELGSVKMHF